MALIQKAAIERLIMNAKAQTVGPEDIIALQNAIASERAARIGSTKVRALTSTNITSEPEGTEIKRTITFATQAGDGIVLPYLLGYTSYMGVQSNEIFDINTRTITELNASGIIVRTAIGVQLTSAIIWVLTT